MADTGIIRWPINFPPSSNAANLRTASVGRTTYNTRTTGEIIMAQIKHVKKVEPSVAEKEAEK